MRSPAETKIEFLTSALAAATFAARKSALPTPPKESDDVAMWPWKSLMARIRSRTSLGGGSAVGGVSAVGIGAIAVGRWVAGSSMVGTGADIVVGSVTDGVVTSSVDTAVGLPTVGTDVAFSPEHPTSSNAAVSSRSNGSDLFIPISGLSIGVSIGSVCVVTLWVFY